MNDFVVDRDKRTITTSLGTMDFSNVVLNEDVLELYLDIENVSEDFQKQIDRAIRQNTEIRYAEREEYYKSKGLLSVDSIQMKEVFKALNLYFADGNVRAEINVSCIDSTETLEVDISFPVDVKPIYEEIKKIALKTIEQRYFT